MLIRKIVGGTICCAVVIGVYLYAMSGMLNQTELSQLPIGQMKERVQADTIFEQTIHYTDCGEDETIREKASSEVVGMTRDEVATLYHEWQIDVFTPKLVMLQLSVNGVCKEHRKKRFVGIRDGKVAVYYGTPTDKPILKEMTDITVTSLVEQVQQELKQGIVYQTEEERLRIMEGLQAR